MRRSAEEWIQYAKHHHKFIVFYEEKVMDITDFIQRHPGGKKALANYIYKDITDLLFNVYKHEREPTLATLNTLVIGTLPSRNRLNTLSPRTKSPLPSSKKKKKVCFRDKSS